mmetsp:Transcript_111740/g.312341  ORF Transcript_111740/g.312341 Transcript_111740/m.312341 type:complete len:264 (-) Transcript_111740:16-807(-)
MALPPCSGADERGGPRSCTRPRAHRCSPMTAPEWLPAGPSSKTVAGDGPWNRVEQLAQFIFDVVEVRSLRWLARPTLLHQLGQFPGQVAVLSQLWSQTHADVEADARVCALARELVAIRELARQHLVHQHGEGKDIYAVIVIAALLALKDLGGHPTPSAHAHGHGRPRRLGPLRRGPSEAEVCDLREGLLISRPDRFRQQDVAALEISMQNRRLVIVQALHAGRHIMEDLDDLPEGQLLFRVVEEVEQATACAEFRDHQVWRG